MNTIASSKKGSHEATTIFLSMVAVAFVLRMAVGEICPIQELFMTALFSVGCGGLYGLHIDKLNVEVLTRYNVVGAAGIAVVLLFFLVPASYKLNSEQQCESIFSFLGAMDPVNVSYANPQQGSLCEDRSGICNSTIKVIYPIGVRNLKEKAFDIKRSISKLFPAADVTVWSRGSWRTAIANQGRDFDYSVNIITRVTFDRNELKALSSAIKSVSGVSVRPVTEKPLSTAKEDISVEIGF